MKHQLILCELADPHLPRLESYSPFCVKVHRALQLCHLPYERRHGGRPAAFKEYNPAAQVPVLLVDGEPVSDSTRILSRLDGISGGALSRGLDTRGKAEAFLWEEMADSALNGFLVAARWIDDDNWKRTKAAYFASMPGPIRAIVPSRIRGEVRQRLVARDVIRPDLATCWSNFEEILDRLEERAPASGYWVGDSPSRADVAIFPQLFGLKTELTPRQAERIDARPRLRGWLERFDQACLSAARSVRQNADVTDESRASARMEAVFG